MDKAERRRIATAFEGLIREIREKQWNNFSAAALSKDIDPYTVLARLLVRVVEGNFEASGDTYVEPHPWEDN